MNNVLIDTSPWIEFFRPKGMANYREAVSRLLDENEAALCGIVLAEILKGARSEKEYDVLNDRLATLHYLSTPESTWEKVGQRANHLRKKGLEIPTTDILIATIAIENRVPLLHKDHHFKFIASHSNLQIIDFL